MRGTEARTEHGEFRFAVKEREDGTPWITAEPLRSSMTMLTDAFIGFQLPKGTTLEQAERIADYMNRNITSISMTLFDSHPMFEHLKP
jgi:hypothetical protein